MKMPNITPGPWKSENSSVINTLDGSIVCTLVQGAVLRKNDCEDYATATAIAALPDLLEALIAVHNDATYGSYAPHEFIKKLIEKSLVKAGFLE